MGNIDSSYRETEPEIIDDVKNFRSEIGVLFLNGVYNQDVSQNALDDSHLKATHLTAQPHIFVSKTSL